MKNKKILALVLVIAVMLMGAAYAQWTQSISVKTSVTSGNFSINLMPAHSLSSNSNIIKTTLDVSNENANQTLNLKAKNVYPGGYMEYRFQIINTGSVDAKQCKDELVMKLNGTDVQGLEEMKQMLSTLGYTLEFPKGHSFANIDQIKVNEVAWVYLKLTMNDDVTAGYNKQLELEITPKFVQSTK